MSQIIKLAEALLRRKELQQKVDSIKGFKEADVYEVHTGRKAAHEGLDDIIAKVPKLNLNEVTAEFDYYARQLRFVDAAIQQANWTSEIEVNDTVMEDYTAKT
jgi:hypothetical protein